MNIYSQIIRRTEILCHSPAQFLLHVQEQENTVRKFCQSNSSKSNLRFYAALLDIPHGKRAVYIQANGRNTILSCKIIDIVRPFPQQRAAEICPRAA